jgi:hypothetical protein
LPRAFRPALEVDTFRWPVAVVQLLQQHGERLASLRDAFEHARARGERTVVFQSTGRGSGCTTFVLASARLLAETGCSVAVVDAEFFRPQLAGALGMAVGEGWERAILAGADLAEVVIQSLADHVSVVPLGEPLAEKQVSEALLPDQVRSLLHPLAEHFDMVLLDAGCPVEFPAVQDALQDAYSAAADACAVVHADDPRIAGGERRVNSSLPVIAIVENFVASDRS